MKASLKLTRSQLHLVSIAVECLPAQFSDGIPALRAAIQRAGKELDKRDKNDQKRLRERTNETIRRLKEYHETQSRTEKA